jgi:DNA-binding transcriptional ArsR family regulator
MALLDEVIGQMKQRRDELAPLAQEYTEIGEALSKLNGIDKAEPNLSPPRAKKAKRGRPRGAGKTMTRIVQLVEREPGLNITEIAKRLRMRPNYLYRALPRLEEEGKVVQDEAKGWRPA